MLDQVVQEETKVLLAVAGPATVAVLAWLWHTFELHVKNKAVQATVARLVRWAQQTIPDKDQRYAEVAAALSHRFPWLDAQEIEVLIESEVHAVKTMQVPAPSAVAVAAPAPAPRAVGITNLGQVPVTITPPGDESTVSAAPDGGRMQDAPTAPVTFVSPAGSSTSVPPPPPPGSDLKDPWLIPVDGQGGVG